MAEVQCRNNYSCSTSVATLIGCVTLPNRNVSLIQIFIEYLSSDVESNVNIILFFLKSASQNKAELMQS